MGRNDDSYTGARDDVLSKFVAFLTILMLGLPLVMMIKPFFDANPHTENTTPGDGDEIVVVAKEALKSTGGNDLGDVNDADELAQADDMYYLAFLDKDDKTYNNYQMRNALVMRHGAQDKDLDPPDDIKGRQPFVAFKSTVPKDVYDRYEIGDTLDGKTYEKITGRTVEKQVDDMSDEQEGTVRWSFVVLAYAIVAMVLVGTVNRRHLVIGTCLTVLAFAGEIAIAIV